MERAAKSSDTSCDNSRSRACSRHAGWSSLLVPDSRTTSGAATRGASAVRRASTDRRASRSARSPRAASESTSASRFLAVRSSRIRCARPAQPSASSAKIARRTVLLRVLSAARKASPRMLTRSPSLPLRGASNQIRRALFAAALRGCPPRASGHPRNRNQP